MSGAWWWDGYREIDRRLDRRECPRAVEVARDLGLRPAARSVAGAQHLRPAGVTG